MGIMYEDDGFTAEDFHNIGLGCALEAFKEVDEIVDLINNLSNSIQDERQHEIVSERFKFVLDLYQEQPHLLDPHLERLLSILVDQVRSVKPAIGPTGDDVTAIASNQNPLLNASCQMMGHIIKVRGPKVVVRYLPHEVADLNMVVDLLQNVATVTETWETRYVLLLWLAIIVLIPFNMGRFDSGERAPLADR